ncbi:NUDIX domain-containing protein [Candidatus Parcubacteria bacterium]|nr:NUDIX domain-containing protein [Candidatus Parcubacteria bacterium]
MPHIHEKIDFTVEVFIVHKNKVLLRKHDKYKIWLSVGGHVELDEDPNAAALREVKEEVGLDVKLFDERKISKVLTEDYKELISPQFLNIHRISPTHEHVVMTYFATSQTDEVKTEKENDEFKWVMREELRTMDLRPHVRIYAEKALEKLSN